MTKIFRCSYYRSKQPDEPPEEDEESAAGEYEYVDLEDGQGKQGGGDERPESGRLVDPDVVFTIHIAALCVMLGSFILSYSYLGTGVVAAWPDDVLQIIPGALLLALGAAAFAGLALRVCTFSTWFTVFC
ncbi:hypothetical protein CFC21_050608 [Triticum aestivum]|uniref:Uncharacterized protein n=2 Tax=Triticum aestivum TaxID=4565 RepID=A0A3B6H4H8_WHEAT|nr:uncharacterized protein LOC123075908 [Triticum aestivum]KAF7040722.1 hypothetical protein CFC21_050608 [Triticum aestivum]